MQSHCYPLFLLLLFPLRVSLSLPLLFSANRPFRGRMAKKRKSENAALDEMERTLYTSFCTTANSISHFYTQAQNQQKLSFQAGERHAVEKLYHWLLREHQSGSNITVAQVIQNLQSELEVGNVDEMTMSPGHQLQQQQMQPSVVGSVGTSGRSSALSTPLDQGKISVFQGALSSPNRRCLTAFAMAPSSYGVHNTSVQPVRRGSLSLDQPAVDLREDRLESATYEDVSTTSFGFQTQHHQDQQSHQHHQHHVQHMRDGSHTLNENDSSMDMRVDGVADDYYC
ncbi:uncharacterized protein [Physcomitrium patens]|uniref:Holocarboxylase synthetase n=1 Tax=Physcomitrium patens TaxID=3218 RepID=A0A7I4D1Y7_PHYPA|nr:uncharacterized protein LOC112279141 isoform X2 [Physcomitrium patens]|eukprot:XP_024369055.1 uncharacterized protein LOC112279141 isoform X2 [Physcomitrella patens]